VRSGRGSRSAAASTSPTSNPGAGRAPARGDSRPARAEARAPRPAPARRRGADGFGRRGRPSAAQSYPFDEATLYDSPNGFLRLLRKLFNPLLRLLFNPTPIAHALAQQSRLNTELLQREAERDRRQAEWNALHYEILQRLALDVSRASVEWQSLSLRVESLGAKVDFNERRVRSMEGTQARPPRPQESTPAPQQTAATVTTTTDLVPQQPAPAEVSRQASRDGDAAGDADGADLARGHRRTPQPPTPMWRPLLSGPRRERRRR